MKVIEIVEWHDSDLKLVVGREPYMTDACVFAKLQAPFTQCDVLNKFGKYGFRLEHPERLSFVVRSGRVRASTEGDGVHNHDLGLESTASL